MLFSLDHGNFACKSMSDSFISGLTEHSVQPPLASDIIEYEDRFWTLSGNRIAYMQDKSKDDRFFILTLFAIARELKSHEDMHGYAEIDLATGLPPEHYSALKDKFTKYLLRDSVKFRYNGSPISLRIRRVFIYPQAYAAVVPQSRLLINTPRIFVIDVGGFTVDVLLLCNGKPDLQFCRSIEMGVISMHNEIIGKVGSLCGMKIEDDHIAAVIQNRETILSDQVIQIIKESAKRYADRILDKLRELQVDLRSNPVIFVGGGSVLFRPYLECSPMVAKAEFVVDPKANAVGYGMLATGQLRTLTLNRGQISENT